MTAPVLASVGGSAWGWHPHPDVWLLVAGLAAAYAYALRRLGGRAEATRRHVVLFSLGLGVLWLHSDWPVHDVGENYLFSVHMVQHTGFQLIAAPLLLLGVPPGLLRLLLVRPRRVHAVVRRIARPLPAGVFFNLVTVLSHWPLVVNASLENHALHLWVHLVIFSAALLMWLPVLNRLPELPSMSYPGRMVYLFLQSVLPTVPASFLTFSESVIYGFYASVPRPFPISALDDQQTAGAVMKIYAALIIWGVIVTMFFRWYAAEQRRPPTPEVLTWAEVERELSRTAAPPGGPGS